MLFQQCVDIFDGQPLEEPDFAVVQLREGIGLFEGHVQTEIGVGNRLAITADDLKRNVRRIQLQNEIEIAAPDAPLETLASSWVKRRIRPLLSSLLGRDGDRNGKDLRIPTDNL